MQVPDHLAARLAGAVTAQAKRDAKAAIREWQRMQRLDRRRNSRSLLR